MSNIVVIGSANMDTTHYLDGEFPTELTSEGENHILRSSKVLGGKGANQANSAKLQGPENEVFFVGCIGKDEAGLAILESLKEKNIDYSGVTILDGLQTDGRIIFVNKEGENKMMGYGDCIKKLTPEILMKERVSKILENADIVMLQMKMPRETVEMVINYCHEHNKQIILDPTPLEKSFPLVEKDNELLRKCSYLTPNEEEAYALCKYIQGCNMEETKEMYENSSAQERNEEIMKLVQEFPNMVVTMGNKGAICNINGRVIQKRPFQTNCKDSTGAGDTFNGAFAAAIARGEKLDEAIDYGQMASSMKIQHEGAQNGVPTKEETDKMLSKILSV